MPNEPLNPYPLDPPSRRLLGPGPSAVHPRVSQALSRPLVGHLDPEFLQIMDETQEMLRQVFRTRNPLTLALSGTGTSGMEAALMNAVEPGDEVLICVNGAFGNRMCEMVERIGGRLRRIERPWGEVFEAAEVEKVLRRHPEIRLVGMVHAETSTGAHQPVAEVGDLCHGRDCLFLVDAVTSLGGTEVEVDAWKIDFCYSATQKCLSCPPGLAPITVSHRALERLRRRKTPPPTWYLDLQLLGNYWGEGQRAYHHTAPIAMNYALHQALALVLEEGLPTRFARHRLHSRALVAGLDALGFQPLVATEFRLPMLTAVRIPQGGEEAGVRRQLLLDYGIEIGGGLGALAGRVWRIGLMGESASRENVLVFLAALEEILYRQGHLPRMGKGTEAASRVYSEASEA